jgi:GNAT superfamily N-acetyltransferase
MELDRALEKLGGPPTGPFDCGRDEQNSFFLEHAWRDQVERLSTTYVLSIHGLVAAFATVCTDAIPLSRSERGTDIPYGQVASLKLAQLGVDVRFQGGGLGQRAVAFVVGLAEDIGNHVGCRYVTLQANPDVERWYQVLGFVRNRLHHQQRLDDAIAHQRDPERIPISMRFDLRRQVRHDDTGWM